MTPHFFTGHNFVYQPPQAWDQQANGDCAPLPVHRDEAGIMSVWRPEPDELAMLNAGGAITIHLCVARQPVMSVGVCAADHVLVSV